jgi:hypothetical protein
VATFDIVDTEPPDGPARRPRRGRLAALAVGVPVLVVVVALGIRAAGAWSFEVVAGSRSAIAVVMP